MEAITGNNMVVQQPMSGPVTFRLRRPVSKGTVKATAIIQIIFGSFCIILGIWAAVRLFLTASLFQLSVWLYIPSGAVGLRAASNDNICAIVAYQTLSLFGCIAGAFQTSYFLTRLFLSRTGIPLWNFQLLVLPILAAIFNLVICIAAGIATSSLQKSAGCCCAKGAVRSDAVIMRSNALNSVAPMPQQQAFTVQQGMSAGPPPFEQTNYNGLTAVSYFN